MIETSNPEIDVNELMERVRREAARALSHPAEGRPRPTVRRAALPDISEIEEIAPPSLTFSGAIESMKEGMNALILKARRMTEVSSGIPKTLRGFFRRQGGFNQTVIEAITALTEKNEALGVRVGELITAADVQNQWLHALARQHQTELRWMRAAQEGISQITLWQTQVERQGELLRSTSELLAKLQAERHGEHLAELQAEASRLREQGRALQGQAERSGEHLRNLQTQTERAGQDLRVLRQMVVQSEERQLSDAIHMKGQLSQQSSQMQRLVDANRPAQKFIQGQASPEIPEIDAHRLDAFYLSFENRFRGDRAQIKDKIRVYLPLLKDSAAGTSGKPIVDVGCGRGEWLELLKDEGLEVMGIDLNEAMVAQCVERKLPVQQGDAVAYLRGLPENSQGAVTGFHIIEHLPLETLLDLFAETRRVLAPGGLAIFESPNCKNLMVGACNFYVDPTHRNPVFPDTAEFMLWSLGFEKVEIKYLTPVDTAGMPGSDDVAPVLHELLYGPQDFAVIGRKPKTP